MVAGKVEKILKGNLDENPIIFSEVITFSKLSRQ